MEPYLLLSALVLYLVYLRLVPWLYRLTSDERALLVAKHAHRMKTGMMGIFLGLAGVLAIIGASMAGGIYCGNGVYTFVKNKHWLAGDPLCLVEPTWFVIHVSVGTLLFVGLTLTAMLIAGFFSGGFSEYLEVCAAASGYRVLPVLTWTMVPWLLFTGAFLLFACDNFAAVFPTKIVLNRFWSVGSVVYRYEDVLAIEQRSIRHTDKKKQLRIIPAWDIKFADGSTWSTQSNISVEVNPRQLQSHETLARIISKKSGRKILVPADRRQ